MAVLYSDGMCKGGVRPKPTNPPLNPPLTSLILQSVVCSARL